MVTRWTVDVRLARLGDRPHREDEVVLESIASKSDLTSAHGPMQIACRMSSRRGQCELMAGNRYKVQELYPPGIDGLSRDGAGNGSDRMHNLQYKLL